MIRFRDVAHFQIEQESLLKLFNVPVKFERLYRDLYKAGKYVYWFYDGKMWFLSDDLSYHLYVAKRNRCPSETVTSQVAGDLTRYGVPDTFWREFGEYYSDSRYQWKEGNIYLLNPDQKTLHFCAKDSDEYKEFAKRRENLQKQHDELEKLEKTISNLKGKIYKLDKEVDDSEWTENYYSRRREEIRHGMYADFCDTEEDMQELKERAESRTARLIKQLQTCRSELSVLEKYYKESSEEYLAEIDRK